jgi:hypothetical protein
MTASFLFVGTDPERLAILAQPSARNFSELQHRLLPLEGNVHLLRLSSLEAGIERFCKHVQATDLSFDFYRSLLPRMREWALDAASHQPVPMLHSGQPGQVVLSQRQVRHILAVSGLGGGAQGVR